jgi:hypothetical protein
MAGVQQPKRFLAISCGGLNRSCVTGSPPRLTEQKAAKTFEQKEAKVTKSLSSATYVDVLQASPLRLQAISENKPVDAVF